MKTLAIYDFPGKKSKAEHIFQPCEHSWQGQTIRTKIISISRDITPMMWSFQYGQLEFMKQCEKHNHDYYYVDMGHFYRMRPGMNINDAYWRISRGSFLNYKFIERPADRWDNLNIELNDWQTSNSDKHILICAGSAMHQDYMGDKNWVQNTVSYLKKITNRKIVIREKPNKIERDNGSPGLFELLKNTHVVITQGSQAGAEAVINGIPIICSPKSHMNMLGSTSLDDVENPSKPDRRPGLYHIAYSQFTKQELMSGYVWDIVNK